MIFKKANILLPNVSDYSKWSVVACDQYTSEPEYWNGVKEYIGRSASTLKLVFPEVYLDQGGRKARINKINETMQKYLDSGKFTEYKDSLILTQRTQRDGRTRYGIVGCVDLEKYNFKKGATPLIRATEGTVIERIPPRVEIRQNAPLEFPHIILLADDKNKTIIEPLIAKKDELKKVYDFDLMQNSGHLTGYLLNGKVADGVLKAVDKLGDKEAFSKKHGTDKVLQLAVGDGNHSLATAKTVWENVKPTLSSDQKRNHPARFALVEVMNIYDEALEFEPIHRIVFGANPKELISALQDYATKLDGMSNAQSIKIIQNGKAKEFTFDSPIQNLAVGTLQVFLDDYAKTHDITIDYIHGEDVVRSLSKQDNAIGFLLPSMQKEELFPTVIKDGALPRKTFSMGEAHDKRFYMEGKAIKSLES